MAFLEDPAIFFKTKVVVSKYNKDYQFVTNFVVISILLINSLLDNIFHIYDPCDPS